MTGLQQIVQSVMSNIYPRDGYILPTGGTWKTDEQGNTVYDNTQNSASNIALNQKRSYTPLIVVAVIFLILIRK